MKKIFTSIALAGLLTISPAWAQTENAETEMERAFLKADATADDHVDEGEFHIYNMDIFDALDENGDHILVHVECAKNCFLPASKEKSSRDIASHYHFEALDADHNRKVEEVEYTAYARRQFIDYDRNADRFLDKPEFYAFYQGLDERTFMVETNKSAKEEEK